MPKDAKGKKDTVEDSDGSIQEWLIYYSISHSISYDTYSVPVFYRRLGGSFMFIALNEVVSDSRWAV